MSAVIKTILTLLLTIDCIALVVVIMMQKSKDRGLGAIGGMNTDTYWGKNKGRSVEGNLVRITRILGVLFFVLAVVLNMKMF